MREIKFRGKAIDEQYGWVYGEVETFSYAIGGNKVVIHGFNDWGLNSSIPVNQKTIGQYTGLKDKNGIEIYEDDIVSSNSHTPKQMTVGFLEGGFCMDGKNMWPIDISHFYPSVGTDIEVIGNIHQNPELMDLSTEMN